DGPQSLAGDAAPVRCHDPADCPPDFAGCPAYRFRRPACESDSDCSGSARCDWDHYCTAPEVANASRPVMNEDGPEIGDDERLSAAVPAALRRYRTAALSSPPRSPSTRFHDGVASDPSEP